jgi:hypothetical protein
MNQTTNTTASIDLAQLDKLPRWIDNQKGNDPLMDDMIHYIEQLLARRSLTSGALAAKKNEAGFYPCPVPACGSDLVGTGRLPCGVDTVCCGRESWLSAVPAQRSGQRHHGQGWQGCSIAHLR